MREQHLSHTVHLSCGRLCVSWSLSKYWPSQWLNCKFHGWGT